MVLFWIYDLSSNSSNPCQTLDSYILARPGAPYGFIQANLAISIIGSIIIAASQFWWIRNRNEPHLLNRSFTATICINLAFFLQVWVTCIRRTVMDQHGHANMPCHLHAILWFMIGPLFSIGVFFRMFLVANRLRFTKAAATRHKIDMFADDSQSVASNNYGSDLIKFRAIFKLAFGLNGNGRSSQSLVIHEGNTDTKSEDLDLQLRTLGAATKWETLLILTVIWSAPNVLFMIILFAAFPVYHGPCVGCDVSFELLIAISLANPIIIWSTYKVRSLIHADSDPEGILAEMNLAERCGAMLIMLLCWFLLGFDPNFYDYKQYLTYEWLQVLGIFMIWFILVLMPLVRMEKMKITRHRLHNRKKSAVVDRLDVRFLTTESVFDVLRDPALCDEFEKYAVQEMVVESVRFLQDSDIWKKLFIDKAESWRKSKAKIIMETYIYVGSPLQINISSIERERVEKAFNEPVIRENLFDPAIQSIANLLKQGALMHFLKRRSGIVSSKV